MNIGNDSNTCKQDKATPEGDLSGCVGFAIPI